MINEKGLSEQVTEKIGEFVTRKNSLAEIIEYLESNSSLCEIKTVKESLESMKLFTKYAVINGIEPKIVFDLSLARGLDYYTGIIFETVFAHEPQNTSSAAASHGDDETGHVGSIAAGGRYDNLVSMFESNKKVIPCVGLSIGIERIFAVIEALNRDNVRTTETEVFVISAQKNLGTFHKTISLL